MSKYWFINFQLYLEFESVFHYCPVFIPLYVYMYGHVCVFLWPCVCVCVYVCALYRHCGYSKAFQDSDEEKMHYQNGHGMFGPFLNYY